MAAPETNLSSARPAEVSTGHNGTNSTSNSQNFNAFQFVSQLVSATPPYLFNMTSPFPGNFFSDLLRRMAPRAGTPGLSLDATLQQHIRAALLAKSPPHPGLPPVLPQPIDIAAMAAHRQQLSSSNQDKGIKRPLFSDTPSLNMREEEEKIKRPRLDENRDERRKLHEGLTPSFMFQPPFLPSAMQHHQDLLSPWNPNHSILRPQLPLPGTMPQGPLDSYRLLLDLRLAGQLRTMAATQALHHKDTTPSSNILSNPAPILPSAGRISPLRDLRPKEETINILSHGDHPRDETRVSAFHPPTKINDNNEEADNQSNSSNSSSVSKDSVGTQYIFKHLTDIYRTIDHQKPEESEAKSKKTEDHTEYLKPLSERELDRDEPKIYSPAYPQPIFPSLNGHSEKPGNFKANITIKSTELDNDIDKN